MKRLILVVLMLWAAVGDGAIRRRPRPSNGGPADFEETKFPIDETSPFGDTSFDENPFDETFPTDEKSPFDEKSTFEDTTPAIATASFDDDEPDEVPEIPEERFKRKFTKSFDEKEPVEVTEFPEERFKKKFTKSFDDKESVEVTEFPEERFKKKFTKSFDDQEPDEVTEFPEERFKRKFTKSFDDQEPDEVTEFPEERFKRKFTKSFDERIPLEMTEFPEERFQKKFTTSFDDQEPIEVTKFPEGRFKTKFTKSFDDQVPAEVAKFPGFKKNPKLDRPLFEGLFKPEEQCECRSLSASKVIKGAEFDSTNGANVSHECGLPVAARLTDGVYIQYNNVDFHDGYKVIRLRFSNGSPSSVTPFLVKFYLDQPRGAPFASFNVQPTGGWCTFIELRQYVLTVPKGLHNLYIFSSVSKLPGFGLFNLDWFLFTEKL